MAADPIDRAAKTIGHHFTERDEDSGCALAPQAWRFGDGPNQFYADHYATTSARLDYDLDYDESRFDQYKAEFLADLAAHDAEVRAGALRMAANALYDDDRANGKHSQPLSLASWLRDLADRIEQGANR